MNIWKLILFVVLKGMSAHVTGNSDSDVNQMKNSSVAENFGGQSGIVASGGGSTVGEEMGELELIVGDLKAGVETTITCRVQGGNPPPSLALSLGGEEEATTTTSGSVTTATLSFTPLSQDKGKNVTCLAVQTDNQATVLYTKQKTQTSNVLFAPQWDLKDTSYIEAELSSPVCLPLTIEANPEPVTVTWTLHLCGESKSKEKKEHKCLSTLQMGEKDGKYSASNMTQSHTQGNHLLYLVNMTINKVTEKDYSAKFEINVTNKVGSNIHTFYLIPEKQFDQISGKKVKKIDAVVKAGMIAGILVLAMLIIFVLGILVIHKIKNKNSSEEQPLTRENK